MGSTWGKLEDEIRDVVTRSDSGIDAVWTYSGAIFRDKENPDNEMPEDDFSNVVRLTKGKFGIPDATYKVVGWFDENHRFQARAYVFEQKHTGNVQNGELILNYQLGNTKLPFVDYLVTIDELEKRIGVDFFPKMKDFIEELIEKTKYEDIWGAE